MLDVDRIRNLPANLDAMGDAQLPSPQALREGLSIDVFHGDEYAALGSLCRIVDRHDVRVLETDRDARFRQECRRRCVSPSRWSPRDFEGNFPVVNWIIG